MILRTVLGRIDIAPTKLATEFSHGLQEFPNTKRSRKTNDLAGG
jgi:hypothetical protein